MEHAEKEIIGTQIKTCNRENQAMHDTMMEWSKFMKEGIMDKIPEKESPTIYAIYSDYEGDYMEPYLFTLGCSVKPGTKVPEGMKKVVLELGEYKVFNAAGKMPEALIDKWKEIWATDINRSYRTDFEVYDEKSMNPENPNVNIYIGIKS